MQLSELIKVLESMNDNTKIDSITFTVNFSSPTLELPQAQQESKVLKVEVPKEMLEEEF